MLLYRAARSGAFGSRMRFERGSITDALFVYLDGAPEDESVKALAEGFMARPWVCLTSEWESCVRKRFPNGKVYRRTLMKPLQRFHFPKAAPLPEVCCLAGMDGKAFDAHPFGHGANYPSYEAFKTEGAGAVIWRNGEIVASASSFLSLDGEVELDVSTKEGHRGQGLATACVDAMLRDCEARSILVHWDAQNDASRRLAGKFGFEPARDYRVYWVEQGP